LNTHLTNTKTDMTTQQIKMETSSKTEIASKTWTSSKTAQRDEFNGH
jgi:hypothetical protein